MPLSKPFPHIFRNRTDVIYEAFREMSASPEGKSSLVAYAILRADLNLLFEYVEPDMVNLSTYSHRTYELLLRICTEIESNFKIIFTKNRVALGTEKNIIRYSDLDGPMKLSTVEISCLKSSHLTYRPFEAFANSKRENRSPFWYKEFNIVKHDRAQNFSNASLKNVILALGALYVLLDAQFGNGYGFTNDVQHRNFVPHPDEIFTLTRTPIWQPEEQYHIENWEQLKKAGEPFGKCPIPKRS